MKTKKEMNAQLVAALRPRTQALLAQFESAKVLPNGLLLDKELLARLIEVSLEPINELTGHLYDNLVGQEEDDEG